MGRVQFGLFMPAGPRDEAGKASFVRDLDRALDLASGHFDSAWFIDHLQHGDTNLLEGFTALTYMAARNSQLKFGHAVLCQSFRNPALLAKMAATLQFMTGGRFIFGIGAGWNEEEYLAYGYDFPANRVRVEQLEEALQVIKGMWAEDSFTFEGAYYGVKGAVCEPKPLPPLPVMVGALGPKMLRLTAKHAGWWDASSAGISQYRCLAEEFGRACAEVGRDPATVRRSWSGGCACASTREEALRLAGDTVSAESDEDFGFVGTPQDVVEQMRAFIEEGVDYFMIDCADFPRLDMLRLLIDEVLPALST